MVDDSMGKHLILASTQRMHEFLDYMDRFQQLTYSDVRDIVTVGVWNEETQVHLFDLLQQAQMHRVPAPGLIPNLEKELRKAVSYTFRIVDKVGGISGVGSLVFKRGDHGAPWALWIPVPHWMVRNYSEGQFGRISGLPRTGKTNLACFLMEKWAEVPKCVSISNIMPTTPDKRYLYVKDAKALFETVALLPDNIKWMFVLDEGGLIYGKADASTRRAKDLDKLVRVLGKLHGNMVIIEQRVESVPTIIQEFAMNIYFTKSKGHISVDLRGPELTYQTWVHGFPKTDLPFDTYDIAHFDTETFNVAGLLAALSGQKDVKGAMRAFLAKEYKSSSNKFKKAAASAKVAALLPPPPLPPPVPDEDEELPGGPGEAEA